MKLSHKLILGALLLASLVWVVGLYAVTVSERALADYIEESSAVLATKIMDEVDRAIDAGIDDWLVYSASPLLQRTIRASNQEFEKLQDVEAHLDAQDSAWRAAPPGTTTPFMDSLLSNELSEAVRRKLKVFEQEEGYKAYGEVFVTNKHGANVAQTGRTTDYRQDDEQWWQRAKEDGVFVADVQYDKSAGVYSTDVCVRATDDQGNFIGVIKAVYNIEGLFVLLRSRMSGSQAGLAGHCDPNLALLTAGRRVIFPSHNSSVGLLDGSGLLRGWDPSGRGAVQTYRRHDEKRGDILACCVTSQGYDDFKGLGWMLVAEHGADEVLAPVTNLRTRILMISVGVAVVGLAFGMWLSISVSRRITRLRNAALQIGKGNLDAVLQEQARDEIGQLARSFNEMTQELSETLVSKTALEKANRQLTSEIGQRTRAEEELKASNRRLSVAKDSLQARNEDLRDFVYIASHDLREPLRKISAFGALVQEALQDKLVDDDRENLDYMIDGADRMTQMIEGLLVYSRLNTKEVAFRAVDCNEMVRQLEQIELAALLEETGATIEVPRALPKVKGNPGQVRQLLQNLIGNGIKYRRDGCPPRIVVEARPAGGETVRIEVRDNGIGIKETHSKDIFKMFRRLHSRREYSGTGIGLAVCKKIVEKHGGQIGVESKPGEGSTFWFTLTSAAEPVEDRMEAVVAST